MQKTIKDFTELELKAMAYDQISQLEKSQNLLKIINDELSSRYSTESREQNAQNINNKMEENTQENVVESTEVVEENSAQDSIEEAE